MSPNRVPVWMMIPTFYPVIGGAQSQVQRFSKALRARGWSVNVLTRRHGYPGLGDGCPARDILDNIPITRLYSRGGKLGSLLYLLGGLWVLLRHGRQGIYHAHDDVGAACWLAITARYLLGGRCVIKLRTGRYIYDKRYASGLARWRFVTLLHLADRVIVVNREVEKLMEILGIPASQVIRLPNAVDTHQFYPVSVGAKLTIRERLGLPGRKTIFLYVGRLDQYKGVETLSRAWALLPIDVRDTACLVMVGDGPLRDQACRMLTALGVNGSVSMVGMQQVVRDYYWAADVFVLPSQTEGLSNALVEAMACGLPVVASNVGGAPDIVEEGKNGIFFEAENYNQLAQKLIEIMAVPERWPKMGAHSRQTVIAYADLDVIVDRLHELYCQLL